AGVRNSLHIRDSGQLVLVAAVDRVGDDVAHVQSREAGVQAAGGEGVHGAPGGGAVGQQQLDLVVQSAVALADHHGVVAGDGLGVDPQHIAIVVQVDGDLLVGGVGQVALVDDGLVLGVDAVGLVSHGDALVLGEAV